MENMNLSDQSNEIEDKELQDTVVEAAADSMKENDRPAIQVAREKLEKELQTAKDKSFAEPVIGYLLKRCEEDEGLAEDIAQEHKTWYKCFDYIYEQARKQATGNRAVVRDEVVFEWAEDYYRKDDKAEEEEKAKRAAEAKAKREKAAAEKKKLVKKKSSKTDVNTAVDNGKTENPAKEENHKEPPKPKRNGKDMEGQMDLFSMLGI